MRVPVKRETTDWGYSKVIAENPCATVGVFRCERGRSLPVHTHTADEYCHLISGSGVFVVGDDETEVAAGETFRIPKNTPHRSYGTGPDGFVSVYVVM